MTSYKSTTVENRGIKGVRLFHDSVIITNNMARPIFKQKKISAFNYSTILQFFLIKWSECCSTMNSKSKRKTFSIKLLIVLNNNFSYF